MAQASTARGQSEFSFVEAEHAIIRFWEEHDIFQRTLEATASSQPYIFYDGPPFATGLPHHGHLLASTIKDIVPRYWTMKGRYVMRRFGWDCHGLPIEHEIDKQFGASTHDILQQLGVAGYNEACRGIVLRYVDDWRGTITRLGRWVDFDNDYKTMDTWYMESVWWVLKQLWEKGLVYQGSKVMPISTALATPLANFEAGQNYLDVQDPAVTVLLKIEGREEFLSIWTTTPWTLPSNLAVCVGADIDYARVRDDASGRVFYLAEARVSAYEKRHALTVLDRCRGADLVGLRYEPLFEYFAEQAQRGAFVVLADDYVTVDDGTGLVHQAPAFGEDDYRVIREAGLDVFACPVGMDGVFTDEVTDFAGQYVKDADKEIIRALKDSGALFEQDTIEHSYPFCYRSDTPLIYRAIPSWFIRVTDIVDDMVAANAQVNWVPEHMKDGRFGNFLRGAIDWSISRNRVWGTPLPFWINDETGDAVCIGSVDELAELTGERVDDLHRQFVDPLTFTKPGEPGTYRRVSEVLDCWFESGSMPYAQLHYPFENQDVFEAGFPAEFIAEGVDQTRGWFYTLTVLGAALYQKPAFRNVIVNGTLMAPDGKKMSKRLRNYTAPDELMETYGADALRLYFITSGGVRGEEMRFSDDGVRDMVRRVLLPWYNAYNFLSTYAEIDGWSPVDALEFGDNILDQWLLSRLQTLKAHIETEMAAYRLYNVVPALLAFIDELTNWYIRLNRSRFWGDQMTADKRSAYSALYTAVDEFGAAMAPFAPFLSEHVYRALGDLGASADRLESVHLCSYPTADPARANRVLEEAVDKMQQVILLGRQKREEAKVGLRVPLRELVIVHRDVGLLAEIKRLEATIKAELNVKNVRYSEEEDAYIRLFAKPNFPVLGKRLGKKMKSAQARIKAMDAGEIEQLVADDAVELDGERYTGEEIEVLREAREGTNAVSNRYISIDLDCELDDDLIVEGLAREIVNRVQKARKDQGLHVADRIRLSWTAGGRLATAIERHGAYIGQEVLAQELTERPGPLQVAAAVGEESMSFTIEVVPRLAS